MTSLLQGDKTMSVLGKNSYQWKEAIQSCELSEKERIEIAREAYLINHYFKAVTDEDYTVACIKSMFFFFSIRLPENVNSLWELNSNLLLTYIRDKGQVQSFLETNVNGEKISALMIISDEKNVNYFKWVIHELLDRGCTSIFVILGKKLTGSGRDRLIGENCGTGLAAFINVINGKDLGFINRLKPYIFTLYDDYSYLKEIFDRACNYDDTISE